MAEPSQTQTQAPGGAVLLCMYSWSDAPPWDDSTQRSLFLNEVTVVLSCTRCTTHPPKRNKLAGVADTGGAALPSTGDSSRLYLRFESRQAADSWFNESSRQKALSGGADVVVETLDWS